MTTIDQQFVEYIVKNLVSHPDDVVIDRTIDEKGVLLTLTVHEEDLGRIIGRRGATAQSLRALLRALGAKNDARYNLKIENNEDGERSAPAKADEVAENNPPVDNSTDEAVETESDFAKNTRKALAELDDLDV